MRKLPVILFITLNFVALSQNRRKLDSLLRTENKIKADSNGVLHLLKTAWQYNKLKSDSAPFYFNKATELGQRSADHKFFLRAYYEKSYFLKSAGNTKEQIDTLLKALQLSKDFKNQNYQVTFNLELGIAYRRRGIYDKSTRYLLDGLITSQSIKDSNGIYNCFNSLANTYSQAGVVKKSSLDLLRALEYYKKAFLVSNKNNKPVLGMILNNQGVTYYNIGQIKKDSNATKNAIDYYLKSLAIRIEAGDSVGISASYNNLGSAYHDLCEQHKQFQYLDVALNYYQKAIAMDSIITTSEKYSNLTNYAAHLVSLAKYRKDSKLLQKAIGLMQHALVHTTKDHNLYSAMINVESIADSYELLNQKDSALAYFHKFMSMKDSLLNEENKQVAEDLAAKYETDLKDTENNNLKQQAELREEVISKKSNTIKLMVGASVLMLGLIVTVFISRQKINKSRELIRTQQIETEKQKLLIEEKQKEILDSINYSKRLQDAAIPSVEYFKTLLPHSFIFYKPKDIVAGDFYWIHKLKNSGSVLVAAADCTGHGVPGALVSIVCLNALNRCVDEFNLREPAQILDKASSIIQDSFRQSENDVKDGMDIALCLLDLENNKGYFAGANNPVWILSGSEIKEIKGDNQPVGQQHVPKPFVQHTFDLLKGDTILLSTDGYTDQFGGDKGKKLKTKKFKEVFPQLNELEMNQVSNRVASLFGDWKGSYEQVDDVLVIGIRI